MTTTHVLETCIKEKMLLFVNVFMIEVIKSAIVGPCKEAPEGIKINCYKLVVYRMFQYLFV